MGSCFVDEGPSLPEQCFELLARSGIGEDDVQAQGKSGKLRLEISIDCEKLEEAPADIGVVGCHLLVGSIKCRNAFVDHLPHVLTALEIDVFPVKTTEKKRDSPYWQTPNDSPAAFLTPQREFACVLPEEQGAPSSYACVVPDPKPPAQRGHRNVGSFAVSNIERRNLVLKVKQGDRLLPQHFAISFIVVFSRIVHPLSSSYQSAIATCCERSYQKNSFYEAQDQSDRDEISNPLNLFGCYRRGERQSEALFFVGEHEDG